MIDITSSDIQDLLANEAIKTLSPSEETSSKVFSDFGLSDERRQAIDTLISLEKFEELFKLTQGKQFGFFYRCLALNYIIQSCHKNCLDWIYQNTYLENSQTVEILLTRLCDIGYTDFSKYYNHPSQSVRNLIIRTLFANKNSNHLRLFLNDKDKEVRNLATILLNNLS